MCCQVHIFCFIQVAVIEKQVFDFLGFMWTCIIINFLQIIFVITGLFGVCQYRAKITLVVGAINIFVLLTACNGLRFPAVTLIHS
jgi:Na,K-Atpase Interacting protein